jgi:FkbM family methyltransferase
MSLLSVAKRLRRIPAVNRPIRHALRWAVERGLFPSDQAARWSVHGAVELMVGRGATFQMLNAGDDQQVDLLFYGAPYEEGELRLFSNLALYAERVFDLGCNTGVYSLLAAACNSRACVWAFEPHPTNYARLRANIEINGAKRVTAIETAVGEASGTVTLRVPADGSISGVSSVHRDFTDAHFDIEYHDIEVRLVSLDEVVAQIGAVPDLMKIDVEYNEVPVLRGAESMLRAARPTIMMEVLDYDVLVGHKPELRGCVRDALPDVTEIMLRLGYRTYAIGKRGILRVERAGGAPDGARNYLFSPHETADRYTPFDDPSAFAVLMGR